MPNDLSHILEGQTLLLVGGGKMGMALMHGWLGAGLQPTQIMVQEPSPSDDLLASGVTLNPTPEQLDENAPDIIVLAVKPQMVEAVLLSLPNNLRGEALVLSLMAGVPIKTMTKLLGEAASYVRSMPNTPAAIGRGMTGLYADGQASKAQKAAAAGLLGAVGQTVWLDSEKMIDAVTAISGSGPAYVFHLVEAMQAAGISLGLPEEMSRDLAMQTIIGAAAMLEEDGADAVQLRRNVTSPGGTTAAALDVLMAENGLADLMRRAAHAASDRAQELAQIGADEADD